MTESREFPGNLPLLPMGWGAASLDFAAAKDFDQEVQRVTAEAALGQNLDLAMAGESSPRIWLFLHEPGHPSLSAAAALEIARELGSRDQAVLMLDGDDASCSLTRWAGRQEKEGWIDLVRYGASVLTSGVALPFPGRRGYILGVGSFAPTDVDLQEAEDLVNRLKRQADDLLIVAPVGDLGHLWAKVSDIRLLCWDRARTPAATVDRLCAEFEDLSEPLTGLIGFGLPGALEPAATTASPAGEEAPEPVVAAPPDQGHDFGETQAGPQTGEEKEEDEDVEVEIVAEPGLDGAEEPASEMAPATTGSGSGSSRVFWGAALVSLTLIVVVSVYYLKYMRVGDAEGEPPPALMASQEHETGLAAVEQVIPPETVSGPEQDQVAEPLAADAGHRDASPAQDETTMDQTTTDQTTTDQSTAEETRVSEAQVPAQPVPEKPGESAEVLFSMDPYLQEVGSDGWALHLYSFPDSLSAERQAAQLQRRGFRTATLAVELKDKGRWYRVYVGSFMTRGEALAAKDPLLAKLKIDWARVTEF